VNVTANPVSICNGPQVAPAPPPFVELATYAAGGTFTETNSEFNFNSVESVLRVQGSDGHGAWQSEEGNFKTSFRKLLFDSTGAYIGNADLHDQLTVPHQRDCPAPSLLRCRSSMRAHLSAAREHYQDRA